MKIQTLLPSFVIALAMASTAFAGPCDYTPSKLAGKTATAIGSTVAGAGAAAGAGLQAAGYYTLVHAGSGLTMLGSTAAGASAAGTVGIIAGTSGALGTAGAILMAPVTIVVGVITIAGVGVFEGACYFQLERVTDPNAVRSIVESIATKDDAISIIKSNDGDAMTLTVMGETKTYLLRKLYIVDGQLKHRDFGLNTTIGPVAYKSPTIADQDEQQAPAD